MGNNAIIIRTTGCHQNGLHHDAEQVGARAVAELRDGGHNVLSAHVETGGCSIDLLNPNGMLKELRPDQQMEGARRAFERYVADSGGVDSIGAPFPSWDDLPESTRHHWRVAVDLTLPVKK